MINTVKPISIIGIALLILCVLFFSTLAFFDLVSPLPQRDSWWFLTAYVTDWQYRDFLGFIDSLFEKRGLSDNTNPIYRILLLLNIKFFGYDGRNEGIIGFIAMSILAIMPFIYLLLKQKQSDFSAKQLIFAASAFILVMSPISPETYSWPLSIFGYVYVLMFVIYSALVWLYITERITFGPFAIGTSLIFILSGDGPILITLGSQLLVILIVYFTSKRGTTFINKKILFASVFSIVTFLLIFLYANLPYLFKVNNASVADNAVNVSSKFWININAIFTKGVLNKENFTFSSMQGFIEIAVVVFILIGIFAVVRAVFLSGVQNFSEYIGLLFIFSLIISLVLMWLFRAEETLAAPRYAPLIQKLPLGILWFFVGGSKSFNERYIKPKMTLLVSILVVLLISYSGNLLGAYKFVPYSKNWYSGLPKSIIQIYENTNNDTSCQGVPALIGPCTIRKDLQAEVVKYLSDNNLNLFNEKFKSRYGPFPFTTGLQGISVVTWGPRGTNVGGDIPNRMADGRMGMWIVLSRATGLSGLSARIGSIELALTNGGNGLLTTAIDVNALCKESDLTLTLIDPNNKNELEVGKLNCN
jgi:hypothetical protein